MNDTLPLDILSSLNRCSTDNSQLSYTFCNKGIAAFVNHIKMNGKGCSNLMAFNVVESERELRQLEQQMTLRNISKSSFNLPISYDSGKLQLIIFKEELLVY